MTVSTRKRSYPCFSSSSPASASASPSGSQPKQIRYSTRSTTRPKPFTHTQGGGQLSACPITQFKSILPLPLPIVPPRTQTNNRLPMLRLLDLSDDVLMNIITHILSPAREGFRKIVTEEGIKASLNFALSCKSLHKIWLKSMHDLELWVSGNLNDKGLLSIVKGNGSYIHRLGIRKCEKLSANILKSIPIYCSNLRSIDLSYLTKVNNSMIVDLTKRSSASLNFLALHECNAITEEGLLSIAEHSTSLRFLDIGGIRAVDDTIIGKISENLGSTLKTLILSNCTEITDSSMVSLGSHCQNLMSLTMRNLPLLTDNGLHSLVSTGSLGAKIQILDVLDCNGLTLNGYFSTMESYCPHVFRYLEESNYIQHFGERCLRDNIIATMPGLIYRISATDAFRRRPALYFLLLDESTLRPFRVSVQSKSLNLSDFGTVLVSNFGKRPTVHTKHVLLERFGYDSPADDVENNGCVSD